MKPTPHDNTRRGMALVIVLAMLVILLGLAITFMSRVRIERIASSSFAGATATRQLADVAVNLVQGQIQEATTLGGHRPQFHCQRQPLPRLQALLG